MITIIHAGSGAVLGVVTRAPVFLPEGAALIDGNLSGEEQWFDGDRAAAREDAEITLSPSAATVGQLVTISMPEGAWVRLPNGAIAPDFSFIVPPGLKEISVTLVGRYRGAATANVNLPSEAE